MKKYIFSILVCLMLFSVCARPLPACAKSGSSTCQVTATAEETPLPSEPGDGDTGEPEKPDPGDKPEEPDPGKEPSEKPDGPGEGDGTQPGDGDGETEPAAPGTTPEPGDTGSDPEGPDPMPGKGGIPGGGDGQETMPVESMKPTGDGGIAAGDDTDPELSQTAEPAEPDTQQQPETGLSQSTESGQTEPSGQLVAALLVLCILAVLAAAGVFRHFWTWLLFVFSRKSRRQFHGILTGKKNFFIYIRNARDSSRLVQEIIDGAGGFAGCRKEIMKETAVTEIPRQSRMRISYHGRDGMGRCREMAADEQEMFRFLEKLYGTGDVEVRITCRGTGIDISLHFCL